MSTHAAELRHFRILTWLAMQVVTCLLYAALPQSQQTRAFLSTPKDSRKVILATNIAETSITIPGIRFVIDTGKCKEKRHIAGYSGGGSFIGQVWLNRG